MACCQPIVIPDPVNNQLSNYALTTVAGAGAGTGTVLRTNDGYAPESNANGSVLRADTYLTYTPSGSNIGLLTDSATSVSKSITALTDQVYYTIASSNIVGDGNNAYLGTFNFRVRTLTPSLETGGSFHFGVYLSNADTSTRQICGNTYNIPYNVASFLPYTTIGGSGLFIPQANDLIFVDIYNTDSSKSLTIEIEPVAAGNGIYQITRNIGAPVSLYTPA